MIRFKIKDSPIQLEVKTAPTISFNVQEARLIQGYNESYDGPYEVTPAVAAQSLETKSKHMTENVIINAIPYFDVSNNSGGSTVYIGREI